MEPAVSIIVPVYHNRDTLRGLHRRLCDALAPAHPSFEIVFVDDACPDGSLAVLRTLAASDPRVVVLSLGHNVGQHRAVVTGLAHGRGEWLVIMDADLQDPPEAVPRLLARGKDGVAAVFAARRGRYESVGRLATSRLFKWVLHVLTGVPADAGIFCAVQRRLAERLCGMAGRRPFVVAMIGCAGMPTASVPVARAPRPSGQSAYSSWGRVKSACRGIAWALAWKLRARLRLPQPPPVHVPVHARFGGPTGARTTDAPVRRG